MISRKSDNYPNKFKKWGRGGVAAAITTTWLAGFLTTLVLFAGSVIFIKWNGFSAWARRYIFRQTRFDHKNIFKDFLFKINSVYYDRRGLYQEVLSFISTVVSSCDISLLLKENSQFSIKASIGSMPSSFQIKDIEEFLHWLSKFKRSVCRNQLVNKKAFAKIKGDGLQYCVQFHAEACVPLFCGDELLGVINLGSREKNEPYDSATRELLDILSGQASSAIYNAVLFEEILRRNVKLAEVSRLKNRILSNISHELRTPLNSIIGLADLIADGGDGPISKEQREHLKMISESGERLLDTVSSMVDLAKLEANHLSLNVKRINLHRLVSKIVERVSPSKCTALKLSISDSAPSIYGDETWINKLFSHVLGNAAKYTPSGEIIVDAERSGEMLKIGVHDTGIGIPHEKQEDIFNDFIQGSNDACRSHEGMGLGLAISKKIVELHGGRIWLDSNPGHGSHFFITLPIKPTVVKSIEISI